MTSAPGTPGANSGFRPLFALGSGSVRYADADLPSDCLNGNYSVANRSCNGSDGNAYVSLQSAVNNSTGGDTIYVRGSATHYTGNAESGAISGSGSSNSSRLTIEGYQNERPIVRGFNSNSFVNIGNLIVDMNKILGSVAVFGMNYSRMENVEVRHGGHQGMYGVGNSEFINLDVHDNGYWDPPGDHPCPPYDPNHGQCHGVYTGGGPENVNNLFDGGRYHHNSGYGIHCYTYCTNTIIRNLRADHNEATGIIASFREGIKVYNVVVDHNGLSLGGNGLVLIGDHAEAYNITAYNNRDADIQVGNEYVPNGTLRNSIAIPNGISAVSGATLSNNITGGSGSDYFVDPANGDFRLKSSATAAINKGADISYLFTTDYLGAARDSSWDIGAFEYGGVVIGPTPTPVGTVTPTPVPTATVTPTPVPTSNVRISVSAAQAAPGATVTVSVSGNAGVSTRVALYDAAAGDAAGSFNGQWQYLNGTQSSPGTAIANATLTFVMPTVAGTYNFRVFPTDNSTANRLAISGNVTVSGGQTGGDTTAPTVKISSPVSGSVIRRSL